MKTIITIFFVLSILSCDQADKKTQEPSEVLVLNPDVDSTQNANFVDTVSYELLCKSIDTLNSIFAVVKDTVFESEGVEWPGKVVTHPDGAWTLFETSWTDSMHIWSVTTTSKSLRFSSPYQIGDKIAKIQKDGFTFTFNEGDGGEYYYFTNERLKHLGFRVEEKYSNDFYKNVYEKGLVDPMKHLNPNATIVELTITGGCLERDSIEY
jgi:hypothetical protein